MTNTARYTPGPWKWSVDEGQYWIETETEHVCGLVSSEANAKLIAAAPQMAEALIAILNRSNGKLYCTDQETGETFDNLARAALKKVGIE